MRILLAFLLLAAALNAASVVVAPAATLRPLLACWFLTYPNNTQQLPNQIRTLHLVLGYGNAAASNQVIHVQRQAAQGDAPKNIITPLDYNGKQPDVFKTGSHPLVLDLPDARNFLRTRTRNVSWALGHTLLLVTARDLRPDNRCDVLYANHCPVKIPGFCEDGTYCNGREQCEANFVHAAVGEERFGFCRRAAAAPQCLAPLQCNERAMACVEPVRTRAPTGEPTTAANEHASAVDSPSYCTSDAQCNASDTFCQGRTSCQNNHCRLNATYSPCAVGELCRDDRCVPANTTACANQSTCDALASFCRGPATCTGGLCVYNASYVACPPALSSGMARAQVHHSGILSTLCSEEQQACLSYWYCVTDADCDDAKFCTGAETCTNGVCHEGSPVVCPRANRSCSEAYHCGDILVADVPSAMPTAAPDTNNVAVIVLAIVFPAVILLLLLIIVFYFIWSQQAKRVGSPAGLASQLQQQRAALPSMASRLGRQKK